VNRVRATVAAEIILHDLHPRSVERLRFALSYPHPDRAKALRRKADPAGIPLRFECITERPDGSVAVPRGAVDAVRAALAADDLGVDFDDQRALGEPIGPLALPPGIQLRHYQSQGVRALASKVQGMIVLPCSAGKTVLGAGAIAALGRTTIVLAHTDDLIDQWVGEVRGLGVEPGVVDGDRKQLDAPIVVASVFSLAPLLEADPSLGARFGFAIQDECFPAGTMVDGKPIESIRIGDSIRSFRPDGSITLQKVTRTYEREVHDLVRLHFSDGRWLVCTADHKLWLAAGDWVKAADSAGKEVSLDEARRDETLRELRDRGQAADWPILRTVQKREARGPQKDCDSPVRGLRDTCDLLRQARTRTSEDGARILLASAQERVGTREKLSDDESHQQGPCVGQDADEEPDEERLLSREGVSNAGSNGAPTSNPRGEWTGTIDAPENVARCAGTSVASGGDRRDEQGVRAPEPYKGGPCTRSVDDGSRSGRWEPSRDESQRSRRQKDQILGRVRVDRVEVLEPGRDGTFGGLCPNGLVYDLEVERDHAYFANGIAVSNCHHAPAVTTQRCLRHLPARYRLGLTATPDREDGHGKLVDWSFGSRLLVKTVQELVAGGFLLMPRLEVVETGFEFDGDPDTDRRYLTKLHRAIERDADRNALIADCAMWEVQAGETVLLLANRKGLCRKLGKLLKGMGVDARVVVGTTGKRARKASLDDLRSGEASIVIATSLADEGLNVKRLSRVILAFPETARGKTVQRVGRLTRLFEGKEPRVIDVVDPRVKTLANRAAARRRSYRSIGMDA